MTGKTRLKDSERRKMLVDYLRDGSVPEGFYVKVMKNDNISFRKLRPTLSKEEKIMRLEKQIEKLKQPETEQTTSDSSGSDQAEPSSLQEGDVKIVTESKQESETPLNSVPDDVTPSNTVPDDDSDW